MPGVSERGPSFLLLKGRNRCPRTFAGFSIIQVRSILYLPLGRGVEIIGVLSILGVEAFSKPFDTTELEEKIPLYLEHIKNADRFAKLREKEKEILDFSQKARKIFP